MQEQTAQEHLKDYVTSRLPLVAPGLFDGAFDDPSFAVDLTYRPSVQAVPALG